MSMAILVVDARLNFQDKEITRLDINIKRATDIIFDKLHHWLEVIISMLPNLMVALFVLIFFYVAARLVRSGARRVLNRISDKPAINGLFATILHVALISVGLIISLNVLHLEQTVTSLLAGAGIIGLAIGFAFQDISANFISGVLLAFRKPIRVGDIINSQGYTGVVEKIDMRVTVIRTFQGLHVIIPNKDVFQTPVTNYTKTSERRIDLSVGISYAEDLKKVREITLNAINRLDCHLANKKVKFFYNEFGDSSINFTVMVWVHYSIEQEFLEARSDIIMAIKKSFDSNGITIPFPIRTLDFGIKGGEKLSQTKINLLTDGEAISKIN